LGGWSVIVWAVGSGGKVGGWTRDPDQSRYGCFLPDLTGLASNPSAANLPKGLYQLSPILGQGVRARGQGLKFKL